MWIPGSYDAELNLAFFGPAQTYDTGPLRNSIGARGVTNESLYTDSTMALDPEYRQAGVLDSRLPAIAVWEKFGGSAGRNSG